MTRKGAIVWAVAAAAGLVILERGLSAGLSRIGLMAGTAIGVVYGLAPAGKPVIGLEAWLALKRGLAFGLVTALGFWSYRGADTGVSWAIGGTLGVFGGVLVARFGRFALSRRIP